MSLIVKRRPADEARTRMQNKLLDVQSKAEQLHEVINSITDQAVEHATLVLEESNRLKFMTQYSTASQKLEICLSQLLVISEALTSSEDNSNGFLTIEDKTRQEEFNKTSQSKITKGKKRKSILKNDEIDLHPSPKKSLKPVILCDECGTAFMSKYALKMHIRSKHTDKSLLPFVCDLCPPDNVKRYSRRDHLKEHQNAIHYKQYNYYCSDCNQGFWRPSHLAKHQRTKHVQEIDNNKSPSMAQQTKSEPEAMSNSDPGRPECPENLQKTATISKHHMCVLCDPPGEFFNKKEFMLHLHEIHGEKLEVTVDSDEESTEQYECVLCQPSSVLTSKEDFQVHLQEVHRLGIVFVCRQGCGSAFHEQEMRNDHERNCKETVLESTEVVEQQDNIEAIVVTEES